MKIQVPLFLIALLASFVAPLVGSHHGAIEATASWPFYLSAGLGAASLFAIFRAQMELLRRSQGPDGATVPPRSSWQSVAMAATAGSGLAFLYGALGTVGILLPNG